jgi:hypothetical protein
MGTRGYLWHHDETGERYCRRCNNWKPVDAFNWRNRLLGLRQYVCADCQRQQQRNRYAANPEKVRVINRVSALNSREAAREFVYSYLLSHPCVDCGERNPALLTFDHINGTKTSDISNMIQHQYSIDRIQQEIDKCEVRCFNCHNLIEQKRRGAYRWQRGNGG